MQRPVPARRRPRARRRAAPRPAPVEEDEYHEDFMVRYRNRGKAEGAREIVACEVAGALDNVRKIEEEIAKKAKSKRG